MLPRLSIKCQLTSLYLFVPRCTIALEIFASFSVVLASINSRFGGLFVWSNTCMTLKLAKLENFWHLTGWEICDILCLRWPNNLLLKLGHIWERNGMLPLEHWTTSTTGINWYCLGKTKMCSQLPLMNGMDPSRCFGDYTNSYRLLGSEGRWEIFLGHLSLPFSQTAYNKLYTFWETISQFWTLRSSLLATEFKLYI